MLVGLILLSSLGITGRWEYLSTGEAFLDPCLLPPVMLVLVGSWGRSG